MKTTCSSEVFACMNSKNFDKTNPFAALPQYIIPESYIGFVVWV